VYELERVLEPYVEDLAVAFATRQPAATVTIRVVQGARTLYSRIAGSESESVEREDALKEAGEFEFAAQDTRVVSAEGVDGEVEAAGEEGILPVEDEVDVAGVCPAISPVLRARRRLSSLHPVIQCVCTLN